MTSICFACSSSFIARHSLPSSIPTCGRRQQVKFPRYFVRRARAAAEPLNKPCVDSLALEPETKHASDAVSGKVAGPQDGRQRVSVYTTRKQEKEADFTRFFGWVPYAETLNGRLAMFFIFTGVLTELWTGYTLPQQVGLMLRVLRSIGIF